MNTEHAAFEYFLAVRDGRSCESGSTLLGYDAAEARLVVKRMLDQFVMEGFVIFCSFIVPNVWIAQRGADYTVLEMLTVGVN